MWRPRRTFKGVMRWRMKDPPDLAMRCRFAAILLVGFCGAFRRSDLVNLDVEDLAKTDEGLVLMLKKGKTDQ